VIEVIEQPCGLVLHQSRVLRYTQIKTVLISLPLRFHHATATEHDATSSTTTAAATAEETQASRRSWCPCRTYATWDAWREQSDSAGHASSYGAADADEEDTGTRGSDDR
jgi:hypothetical protein